MVSTTILNIPLYFFILEEAYFQFSAFVKGIQCWSIVLAEGVRCISEVTVSQGLQK